MEGYILQTRQRNAPEIVAEKNKKEMGPTDIYKAVTSVLKEKLSSFLQNVSMKEHVCTHPHKDCC